MPARSDDAAREALRSGLRAALARRDQQLEEADRIKAEATSEFWRAVAALKNSYRGAQNDIAAETGYSRDHIAKQTKKLSA